jgi:hypothetical protein
LEHVFLEKVRLEIIYCDGSKGPSSNGFTFTLKKKKLGV